MLQCRMCGPACDAAGRYGGCPRVWDLSGSPDSGYTTGRACASLERIDGSHHCSTGFFGGVCARVERQHRSVLPSAASPASSCMVTACCMPLNSPVSVVCCLREHSVPHIVQEPRHRPGAPCQGRLSELLERQGRGNCGRGRCHGTPGAVQHNCEKEKGAAWWTRASMLRRRH